jgi:hypothetical protein
MMTPTKSPLTREIVLSRPPPPDRSDLDTLGRLRLEAILIDLRDQIAVRCLLARRRPAPGW